MADTGSTRKPRPRRGPAWAYLVGGALGLPFAFPCIVGMLHLPTADFIVPPTGTLALFGVLLGGNAYRVFSKPLAPSSKRP